MDGNIARIARACSVDIDRRGGRFRVFGDKANVAADAIRFLYARAEEGIAECDVQMCLAERISGEVATAATAEDENDNATIGRGKNARADLFMPRNDNQKLMLDKIRIQRQICKQNRRQRQSRRNRQTDITG